MEKQFSDRYQHFIDYLRLEKRYSPHTIRAYEDDLERFFCFVKDTYQEVPEEIPADMIRSWMADLKQKGISSRSINRKLSTLRSWGKYRLRRGQILADPARRVPAPRSGKRLPDFVDLTAMRRLSNREPFPATFEGYTQYLIINLLYTTGIRRSELVQLTPQSLDHAASTLKVMGKGGKERIIPLSPELLEQIDRYREEKHKLPVADFRYLLNTPSGRPIYSQYVYRTVRRYLGLVTTLKRKGPHILRHTFATHLVNAGADLNAVKELLGHASLAATQVYTHNTIEQLKEVHSQAHPRSGK